MHPLHHLKMTMQRSKTSYAEYSLRAVKCTRTVAMSLFYSRTCEPTRSCGVTPIPLQTWKITYTLPTTRTMSVLNWSGFAALCATKPYPVKMWWPPCKTLNAANRTEVTIETRGEKGKGVYICDPTTSPVDEPAFAVSYSHICGKSSLLVYAGCYFRWLSAMELAENPGTRVGADRRSDYNSEVPSQDIFSVSYSFWAEYRRVSNLLEKINEEDVTKHRGWGKNGLICQCVKQNANNINACMRSIGRVLVHSM